MKAIETTGTIDDRGMLCIDKTSDSIVLVTIYSKSDLSDIVAETVREILGQYEQQFPESEEL
ncbi:hypothetical protein [Tychonema sp. BBK16]|uniref:hypothetical protein n=1 Tax=Tychonema sp. BBK16 TaxID=2699888 RepID=UPI001F2A6596|nr:hypothetical protein [Tychonema sp. BBK16]MCF6373974.1 hypothetical protein [Tychonema sp. BBK16]